MASDNSSVTISITNCDLICVINLLSEKNPEIIIYDTTADVSLRGGHVQVSMPVSSKIDANLTFTGQEGA